LKKLFIHPPGACFFSALPSKGNRHAKAFRLFSLEKTMKFLYPGLWPDPFYPWVNFSRLNIPHSSRDGSTYSTANIGWGHRRGLLAPRINRPSARLRWLKPFQRNLPIPISPPIHRHRLPYYGLFTLPSGILILEDGCLAVEGGIKRGNTPKN
jgi:hypothetical protein